MKLKSLKCVEVFNIESAELVNGGTVPTESTNGDVTSTSGDSVSQD